jgi:N-acetylneuraminic acid mutarotase
MGKSAAAMLVLVFLTASSLMVAKPAFSSADTAEGTWAAKEPMHVARSNLGVAVVNGKIYAIGGFVENGGVTGANEEYDPETDTWTFRKPMPTPRTDFSVEVYEDKIYCIGGAGGENEVYDPATDTWETKAPLPNPRDSFLTVVFRNRIYVIGGIKGRAYMRTTEVYDPALDKWEKRAPMVNARFPEACVVINGGIYVISGSTAESVSFTAVYDEETDSWTNKAPMPVVTHGAAVVFDDKIYFMGGNSLLQIYDPSTDTWSEGARLPVEGVSPGSAFMTTGEMAPQRIYVVHDPLRIYDPEKDVWTLGPSKPINRGDMGVTVLNDKIYAIGGFTIAFSGFDSPPAFPVTRYATNEVYTPVGYGTVPPVIDVVSPGSQSYNESSVSLVFTVDKPVNWIGYSLDGEENVTVTGNFTLTRLSNGLHKVTVYANDTSGNMGASETISFTVAVPPEIKVVSPVNQTYNESSVSLVFTVNKPVNWMGYSLDGQDNVTVTGNTTISGLANGLHNVTVYARDELENTGASETITFNVEAPFPTALVAASTASAAIIGVGLLLYFKKRNHKSEK